MQARHAQHHDQPVSLYFSFLSIQIEVENPSLPRQARRLLQRKRHAHQRGVSVRWLHSVGKAATAKCCSALQDTLRESKESCNVPQTHRFPRQPELASRHAIMLRPGAHPYLRRHPNLRFHPNLRPAPVSDPPSLLLRPASSPPPRPAACRCPSCFMWPR